MVKKVLYILIWTITAAGLVALFVFSRKNYLNTPVKAINLVAEADTGFVRKTVLRDELQKICGKSKIGTVNMLAMQKLMNDNPWVKSSNAYIDLDGTLNVSYKEYVPWFRVFGKDGRSVYITHDSIVVPSSRNYTPYVLVASGNFELWNDSVSYKLNDTLDRDRNLLNAICWCNAIDGNRFVSQSIGQLYCNNRNEFELTVKGFVGRVILGDTHDAADKLKRLGIFMKQRIDNPETQTFKSINFSYKNQIVCTKR